MKFIKSITANPVFKVSSLNALSVLVKIAGGLISSKIIAVFIGPSGLALVGNFRNFIRQAEVFSMLGFENGIIKYIAENQKNKTEQHKVISTVFFSVLAAVLLVGILLLLFAAELNKVFFGNNSNYVWIFRVMAFALPMYAGNLVFIGILNGMSRYKDVIKINVAGNIAGVIISGILIWQFAVSGALLGLLVSPSLLFFLTFYLLTKRTGGIKYLRLSNFSRPVFKGLLSFSAMSLVTALVSPLVIISIRTQIMLNYSSDEAGLWEAINRISFFYFMFVSTLLTVYFFPKLSSSNTDKETNAVFKSYYTTIIPVFAFGLLMIYFLKHFIILLLFNDDFLPMEKLFSWQLLGDFFKACSLILGYEFFAKKMTKQFIVAELFSLGILYFSSTHLISHYGSEGAVMGHTVTYFIYLIVLVIVFREKIFTKK